MRGCSNNHKRARRGLTAIKARQDKREAQSDGEVLGDAPVSELALEQEVSHIEAEGEPIKEPKACTRAEVDGGSHTHGIAFAVGVAAGVFKVEDADKACAELEVDLPMTEGFDAFGVDLSVEGSPLEVKMPVEFLLFKDFDADVMGVAAQIFDQAIAQGSGVAVLAGAKGWIVAKSAFKGEAFGEVEGQASFEGEVGEVGVVGDPAKEGTDLEATAFLVGAFGDDGDLFSDGLCGGLGGREQRRQSENIQQESEPISHVEIPSSSSTIDRGRWQV